MEIRNGKYREMLWIGNKLIKSPFFSRKTDAVSWKAKMLNQRVQLQVLGEDYKPQTKATFGEFAADWLEKRIKSIKSPNTYREYESVLRCHLIPCLGIIPLKNIKVTEADNLISELLKKGKSPKGIQNALTILKQILNEAVKREIISRNHLSKYSGIKVPERKFKFWTEQEICKFLLWCKHSKYYSFFVTAFFTGMRKGEIAALTWDCVDFQSNLITVRGTLDKFGHRESTKSGRIRHVPMNDFLKGVLLQVFAKRECNSRYVFLLNGKSIDTNHLYRTFQSIQEKAGITNKIRMHDTRHTFASQYMMKGLGSLFELSQILGHSDTKMTQRYAHLSPLHLSKATANLKFGMENELSKDFTPILPPSEVGQKSYTELMLLESM